MKKILFDLDDTILDFRMAERNSIISSFEHFGIEVSEEIVRRYIEINIACWRKLERGELTRDEVLVKRFELLFAERGIKRDADEVKRYYESLLGCSYYIVPGAVELLDALYGRYGMYIISNGVAAVQRSRLKHTGLSRYFSGVFISEEVGFNKPSKEYFDACFSAIPDFRADDALVVGDSLSADIRGGINAGVRTCWFDRDGAEPTGSIRPDFIIRELRELPALLEKIW